MGIGDWGLGIGPQSPIPNPQSPKTIYKHFKMKFQLIYYNWLNFNKFKNIKNLNFSSCNYSSRFKERLHQTTLMTREGYFHANFQK